MYERRPTSIMDVRRIAYDQLGDGATERLADELVRRYRDRAHELGLRYGNDWSDVFDLPETDWLALVDECMAVCGDEDEGD